MSPSTEFILSEAEGLRTGLAKPIGVVHIPEAAGLPNMMGIGAGRLNPSYESGASKNMGEILGNLIGGTGLFFVGLWMITTGLKQMAGQDLQR